MKCPNCFKEAELYLVLPPRKHLEVGSTIYWCPICGSLFTTPDFTKKIKNLKVPWVSTTYDVPGEEV